jgi:hypothetical protein
MKRVLAVAMILGAAPLAAQGAPQVGTWRMTYPVMMRMENGVATPVSGQGTLTISASGDSLLATLESDPIPDAAARPPQQLSGKPSGNSVVLTGKSRATLNMNGNEREAVAISTWNLKVTNDSLNGTLNRSIEGVAIPGAAPQPVTGVRKKG